MHHYFLILKIKHTVLCRQYGEKIASDPFEDYSFTTVFDDIINQLREVS